MTFPYRAYGGDKPGPSLDVELLGVNGKVVPTLALVDSGAEWTKLPLSVGVELGVDLSLCKPTESQTGAGVSDQEFWWNDSPPGLVREEPGVRINDREVPIAPILAEKMPIVVLGREDFLASFKFTLDQRVERFTLEPYEEPVFEWMRRTGRV
jgi:hypothetical protein